MKETFQQVRDILFEKLDNKMRLPACGSTAMMMPYLSKNRTTPSEILWFQRSNETYGVFHILQQAIERTGNIKNRKLTFN